MPYPIEDKLVVSISSSALFDLTESHRVFVEEGPEAYRIYQENNLDKTLKPGVAFPFIRRLLSLNENFPDKPIEVILLSRNSPETGLRVFKSIKDHSLDISRAGFFSGESPYKYIPAFDTSLFLSSNEGDVLKAIKNGYPAGLVLETVVHDDENDDSLRIAFDFDGVLIDDEAERIYKASGNLNDFHIHETQKTLNPHNPGLLKRFVDKLTKIQSIENNRRELDKDYKKVVKLSIITARNAPSHERVITTMKSWGLSIDNTFFMGGVDKSRILRILKPHMYFDDQMVHLDTSLIDIPLVHIPFGIANEKIEIPVADIKSEN